MRMYERSLWHLPFLTLSLTMDPQNPLDPKHGPPRQPIGPPRQPMGPPRSGAGVGVGMLRGAGGSLT